MGKQQAALEETLMGKMTPGPSEAPGGSSRSKQGFKLLLALVAVMALLIVVLVTAFIYCFFQTQEASRANDPGIFMTNCSWKESKEIFTADDTAKYLVYGWVKFSEVNHQQLTLIISNKNDERPVNMTADKTQTVFYVFEEILMIKNMKLSLSVPDKLSSCTDSRFHVHKV